jgi:hypothetical protein
LRRQSIMQLLKKLGVEFLENHESW